MPFSLQGWELGPEGLCAFCRGPGQPQVRGGSGDQRMEEWKGPQPSRLPSSCEHEQGNGAPERPGPAQGHRQVVSKLGLEARSPHHSVPFSMTVGRTEPKRTLTRWRLQREPPSPSRGEGGVGLGGNGNSVGLAVPTQCDTRAPRTSPAHLPSASGGPRT